MKETRNMSVPVVTIPPVQQAPDNEPESMLRIPLVTIPPAQQPVEDEKPKTLGHMFTEGTWLPSVDPLAIGPKNFSAMQNLKYGEQCLEGVPGYSKINTTALAAYPKIRSGIQLTAPFATKSRVLVQAWNSGLTASQVLQNKTAIPSQGDFETTALHTDAAGAGLGRFARWPGNQIAYCNGKETKIYGGDEIPCAAFITSTAPVTAAELTNPKDFSEQVRNDLQTVDQVAVIGGGIDSYTVLMLHGDGPDGSTTITDSSGSAHSITVHGNVHIDTSQAVFGLGGICFPGAAGDYISTPDHADFNMADGKFTFDRRVKFAALPTDGQAMVLYSQRADASNSAVFSLKNTAGVYSFSLILKTAGAIAYPVNSVVWANPAINTYYHIALVRGWGGAANSWTVTVDGTSLGAATLAATYPDVAAELQIGGNGGVENISVYPPSQSDTYVKATTKLDTTYWPYYATDPTKTLTGTEPNNAWYGANGSITNQRFHIDLGTATVVNKIYYENSHNSGAYTSRGVQHFTVWGSNNATAFANLTYGADTNWTQLTASQSTFDQHVASNVADPKYITVTNTTAYRYIAFKFADNWGAADLMGVRRIELNPVVYVPFYGWQDEIRKSKGITRWTAVFAPPVRAYTIAARTFLIGATRRLQAIGLYIPTGRGNTIDSNLTGKEWTGASWNDLTITADGTKPGSVACAQSGKVSFNSTVDTSVAKYIEGKVLHWYQFALSAGEADIYQVTLDAPWQDVRDCWDGTELLLNSCLVYVAATSSYKDFTGEAADEAASTVVVLNNLAVTEHVIFQSPVPLMGFNIRMSTDAAKVNANAAVMSVAYGNGESIGNWPQVNGFFDGTNAAGKSLKQTGVVSFSPVGPGQEFKCAINGGEPRYSYKVSFAAQLSVSVEAFYITGIPAPQPVKSYIFPFMFLGRPMLCGYKAGGEGNRIDYGMAHASDVHNGPDSSNGVDSAPLYIGGSGDLAAACEVFNRLGASIYSFAVITKAYETHLLNGYDGETYRSYPVSASLGCPAPLTMDAWQTSGTDAAGQAFVRTIAMWISHQGPVMFDAAGLQIIPGLECYFDRRDSRCVNFAALANARGWFDPETGDYNLQIPSGAAQTTNNLWVALDRKKTRWYPVVPSAAASPYLGAAFRVSDTDDKPYVYGARDNGYMMLLHDPATPKWDGTAAVQSVTLGDLVVSGDMWEKGLVNFFKVFGISTAEDTDAAITHYKDGAAAGTSLAAVALNGANRYFKDTQPVNISGWSHRIKIAATISTEKKGLQLLGWGMEYMIDREDH